MHDATMMHELDPLYTVLDLLLVGLILAQIVVLIVRRSAGQCQTIPVGSGGGSWAICGCGSVS